MPTDEEVGEFLISDFKDLMVLKSDGKFIKFGFDFEMPNGNSTDSVDAKIYKYFILIFVKKMRDFFTIPHYFRSYQAFQYQLLPCQFPLFL